MPIVVQPTPERARKNKECEGSWSDDSDSGGSRGNSFITATGSPLKHSGNNGGNSNTHTPSGLQRSFSDEPIPSSNTSPTNSNTDGKDGSTKSKEIPIQPPQQHRSRTLSDASRNSDHRSRDSDMVARSHTDNLVVGSLPPLSRIGGSPIRTFSDNNLFNKTPPTALFAGVRGSHLADGRRHKYTPMRYRILFGSAHFSC